MNDNTAVQTGRRLSIFCKQTHKLLFRTDVKGIYTWCRGDHTEEFTAWDDIGKVLAGEAVDSLIVKLEQS